MDSILPRRGSSNSLNTHHVARKKPSSFLIFKDRMSPSSETNRSPSVPSPSLSSTPRYFDKYPRRPSSSPSSPSRSKFREPKQTASPEGSDGDDTSFAEDVDYRKSMKSRPSTGQSYQFPSLDSADDTLSDFTTVDATPMSSRSRARTRSGPSNKALPHVPPLRFSGSSSQTQVSTPPQTPVDTFYGRPPFDRSVSVLGVDAMDAMVDGMNGLNTETYFESSKSKKLKSRFAKIPNHHPLYQPPLPQPPPGVVLSSKTSQQSLRSYNDEVEEEHSRTSKKKSSSRQSKRKNGRVSSAPPSVVKNVPPLPSPRPPSDRFSKLNSDNEDTPPRSFSSGPGDRKSMAPSISDIIRNYAPPAAQVRTRPNPGRSATYTQGHVHATVREESESEPEPEPLTADEEAQLVGRSSIDSIANEVRQTLKNQRTSKLAAESPPPSHASPIREAFFFSEGPTSPRSDARPLSSVYSSAASAYGPGSTADRTSFSASPLTPSQAIAQYLRSSRLTTLLKLTRYPHATREQPLTVSLSDLGDPNGFPVVMFLGLGCVRHIMGLYDEMAEVLGLRLITIDRWGLGRTDTPRPKSGRGIMEWASVVEEVLDILNIEQCSVMAHSAGAPYALSFANRAPDRIRGDICLLAPWVGGSESGGGYKWLKYVPNGILKTAQAAEWKVQAWMIGKPPALAYEGIGYNAENSTTSPRSTKGNSNRKRSFMRNKSSVYSESKSRPSTDSKSSHFSSDYDDLGDFDGRFESRSTLGAKPPSLYSYASNGYDSKRISSKGFLRRLKSSGAKPGSMPPSPTETPQSPSVTSSRRLKALRSMGSLRSKAASAPNTVIKRSETDGPQLPKPLSLSVALGFDDDWARVATAPSTPLATDQRPISAETTSSSTISDTLEWTRRIAADLPSTPPPPPLKPLLRTSEIVSVSDRSSNSYATSSSRAGGRRSLSLNGPRSSPSTVPTSPVNSMFTSPYAGSIIGHNPAGTYQVALGNALIAASHQESAKGTHSDFLQILNHDNRPWGFQYQSYPHKVQIWYGDKDEKIAENAVRWMERNMGEDRCQVKVVKGADHALMYKSSVVIEVLERMKEQARADACTSWYPPPI